MIHLRIPVSVRIAPRPFLATFGFVLAAWLLASTGASATITTEPYLVGEGEPFRLVVTLGTVGPSGDPEPRVEVDGQEILVHVRMGLGGITGPPDVVTFTADVGPLPEGEYEVKILVSLDGPGVEVDSTTIDVGGTHVSSSIEPSFAVAGRPFELTLRGVGPAACAFEDPYLADGVLVVPFSLDCSVVTPPPPPRPFEHVSTPLVLPAGTYPIVVGLEFSPYIFPYARGEIEVISDPVELHDGLFTVSVGWEDFDGLTGEGLPAVAPSDDSSLFWFFGPDNWELMVKVLDACDVNGHFWVLGAASTTVGYDVAIQGPAVDSRAQSWSYSNPVGQPSEAYADVEAFDCVDVDPPLDPEPPADLPPAVLSSHELRLDPPKIVPGLPARAVIFGMTHCCGSPGVQRVERYGRLFRVHLDMSDFGIQAFSPYQLSVDLGFLEEGEWEIQVVGDETPDEIVELERQAIVVTELVETRAVPRRAMADDEVELFVTGFGSCPSLEIDSIIGRKITALWSHGGCLTPPSIFELSVPLGTLEAGSYEIEVREWSDERLLYGGTTLEVLDAPITVGGGRFLLDAGWRDFEGKTGIGRLVRPPSDDSALFWFFGPDNWELMVKVLDGCDINGHYWVLGAASTNVEYDVTITDNDLGGEWTFHNDLGSASPAFADVEAFGCTGGAS